MVDDGLADLGLEGQGFEVVRGLWWTCEAWSIRGRYFKGGFAFYKLKGFV